MGMTNIIEMKNIHKFYENGDESLEALKGVSFALGQGEILAIMGSSGSGKSTLLHIIGAMDVADEGEIYLNGTRHIFLVCLLRFIRRSGRWDNGEPTKNRYNYWNLEKRFPTIKYKVNVFSLDTILNMVYNTVL